MNATLFDTPPAPKAVKHKLKPWGKPDTRGKYFYQRFNERLDKQPKAVRDAVIRMTCLDNIAHAEEIKKELAYFFAANNFDQADFQQFIGYR